MILYIMVCLQSTVYELGLLLLSFYILGVTGIYSVSHDHIEVIII